MLHCNMIVSTPQKYLRVGELSKPPISLQSETRLKLILELQNRF